MSKIDKNKLPSRHTSLGPDRAPHRSFYYAMGETEQDVAKPFVGVVSTWNEAAPCNTALMRQAQSVKKGVKDARNGRARSHDHDCFDNRSGSYLGQFLLPQICPGWWGKSAGGFAWGRGSSPRPK